MTACSEEPRSDQPPLRVLVVERDAHRRRGHFATRFAELASGFAEVGCHVDVLTSRGWAHEPGPGPARFEIHRYGAVPRAADLVARAIRRLGRYERVCTAARGMGDVLANMATAAALRSCVRRLGRPDLVLVLSYDTMPIVLCSLSGRLRMLMYEFAPPMRWNRWVDRRLTPRARRAEQDRARAGEPCAIVTASREWCDEWEAHVPFLRADVAAITGTTARERGRADGESRAAAKAQLGFEPHERVALLFGSAHDAHDPAVVGRAFRAREGLEGWVLVTGGRLATAFREAGFVADLEMAGYVDIDVRELLYTAADLVVLSFVPGYWRDSGTFMDALSHEVPVVVSRESQASGLVAEYALGVLFEPGDERSLVHAMRCAPAGLDPLAIARARRELSNAAVARRLLTIAGLGRLGGRR